EQVHPPRGPRRRHEGPAADRTPPPHGRDPREARPPHVGATRVDPPPPGAPPPPDGEEQQEGSRPRHVAAGAVKDAQVRVARLELFDTRLPLVAPFETSFGKVDHREPLVVRLEDED